MRSHQKSHLCSSQSTWTNLRDTAQLGRCHWLSGAFQKGPVELLRHCVQSNHPTPPSKWQGIRVGLKGTRAQYTSIHPGKHHSPIHMFTGQGRRQLLISYPRPHRRDVSLGEHRGSGVGQDRVEGSSSSATALSHAQGPRCVQLCPLESTTQEMASRLKLLRSSLSVQSWA